MTGYRLSQIELVSAIMDAINKQIPGLPAESRLVNKVIDAANSICDEFSKPIIKASEGIGLTAWLDSDDVGMSSKYMGAVLSQEYKADFAYPRDVSDLGRCIRMIRAVPELAGRIFILKNNQGPKWAAVAENWDHWCALYDEEYKSGKCPKLYAEMMAAYKETSK